MTSNLARRAARAAAFAAAATLAATTVAPGVAVASQNATVGQTEKAAPKKARRYCVRTEITGSRIAKLECKTREEWIRDNDFDPLRPD